MARRVFVQINGVETDISDGAPFEIIEILNLGASEARRITERSPLQDGDSDIDRRLEPRVISIVLQSRIDDGNYESVRAAINRLFRGTRTPIVLGIEFDNGEIYHIDTYGIGRVELPFNLLATRYINAGVQLRAANPIFYDPINRSQSFGISGGGTAFTIPSVVPTFFGINTLDQTLAIEYDGTYRDFPIITIYGPITDPVITNVSTGKILDFTGYTVSSGDYWTIDLRYGRKLVYRNGDESDTQLYKLSAVSNIADFAIEPDPDVIDGNNIINVTGSGLTTLSQVYIQYRRNFDGI